jgi:hypothetical protein
MQHDALRIGRRAGMEAINGIDCHNGIKPFMENLPSIFSLDA